MNYINENNELNLISIKTSNTLFHINSYLFDNEKKDDISLILLNVILDIYNLNNSKWKDINNNIVSINKTTILTNNNQNEIFINKLVDITSSLIESQINTSNTTSIIENKETINITDVYKKYFDKIITPIQGNVNNIKYILWNSLNTEHITKVIIILSNKKDYYNYYIIGNLLNDIFKVEMIIKTKTIKWNILRKKTWIFNTSLSYILSNKLFNEFNKTKQ